MNNELNLTKQEMSTSKLPTSYSEASDERSLVYKANFAPKIKDFATAEDFLPLMAVVSEWRMYLGIKEEFTTEELKFNANYIKTSYPDFTIEMIRLAIKISLQGKLDVDIKPYGAFSPLYISNILNAYSKYNDRAINDVLREKANKEVAAVNSPPKLQGKDKVDSRAKYLEWYYKSITNREQGFVSDFNSVMWNFLVNNGYLNPDNLNREGAKKFATRMLRAPKNNFDIALATADEWESFMKYYVLRLFFRYIAVKKIELPKQFSAEQIMK